MSECHTDSNGRYDDLLAEICGLIQVLDGNIEQSGHLVEQCTHKLEHLDRLMTADADLTPPQSPLDDTDPDDEERADETTREADIIALQDRLISIEDRITTLADSLQDLREQYSIAQNQTKERPVPRATRTK